MTDEKLSQVLDRYEDALDSEFVKNRMSGGHGEAWDRDHMLRMIPQMRGMIVEGRREKVMRWLGFMQGVFWTYEIYTLDELMDHNRPDGSVFDPSA